MIDVEVRVCQAEGIECFDSGEEAFRIRIHALGPDQFEPGGRELTHPALLRFFVSKRGHDVRQPQRHRRFAHTGCDQPRDGRRHFGSQCDLRSGLIREKKRLLRERLPETGLERIEAFEVRRLDLFVGPAFEHAAQDVFDRTFAAQFRGQPIARSRRQPHRSGACQTRVRPKIDSSSFFT